MILHTFIIDKKPTKGKVSGLTLSKRTTSTISLYIYLTFYIYISTIDKEVTNPKG